ncbi:hypothetical protein CVT26_010122 [Gymnopilus dilepis]|uniref:Uncharacterized protein n=1 Tax=Gymnopilus dilepis TaxID=231916 RepID=A0A409YS67_9AGAR|nr:hypothetical protein CVT26_010122 [Gymnopilus dilepis]
MDETVRCKKHNLPARMFESHSANNPGRIEVIPTDVIFLVWSYFAPEVKSNLPISSAWVDPDPPRNNLPPTPQSGPSNPPRTQTQPPTTPSSSQPLKRNHSAIDASEETPRASQKRSRLEQIQQALAEVQQTLSPLANTPQIQPLVSVPQAGPSSQPKNEHVPTATSLQDPFVGNGTGGAWPPQTPPRPNRNIGTSNTAMSPSLVPLVANTARQPAPPNADIDNSSQVTLSDEETLSAESIAKMVQRLQGVPDYVRKLERQKTAAEKSRDAKQTKIEHLEAEVARLRAREKELEGVIAAYEATK